jgi:hypothetical protein
MYNTCMNNGKLSKTDIENELVQIFEKYPKSLEKVISICFDLILDCFVVIYGEKKTIKLLEQSKKSIRGGNHTQNAVKPRKTSKRSKK